MNENDLKNPTPPLNNVDREKELADRAMKEANRLVKEGTGNAKVHVFDEEMTPEQKMAQAQAALPSTFQGKDTGGKAESMPTDLGTNDASAVAVALASAATAPAVQGAPGAYPAQKSSGLPDWYKVGWTSFSDLPNPGDEKATEEYKASVAASGYVEGVAEKQADMLAEFLKESYYGEWYHNAGVILFTVVFTWLLARIGSGLMSCLVIGAFLGTSSFPLIKADAESEADGVSIH
jgi:hypothetical protein